MSDTRATQTAANILLVPAGASGAPSGAPPDAADTDDDYSKGESGPAGVWLALELLGGAAGFAAVTLIAYTLHSAFSATAFLYLLIIVLGALRWGFRAATVFSVAAILCLDYFFTPPLFSLRITEPSDWIALVAFEFAGLVVSRLSAEAQRQASVANHERDNIDKLYRLARSILLLDPHDAAGAQIARFIQEAIRVESVALFDFSTGQVYGAGAPSEDLDALVLKTWIGHENSDDRVSRVSARVLQLGNRGTGAVAVRAKRLDSLVIDAVASIAAMALERSHSLLKETTAEAARQSEQLRVAVLDALAHAFKTPLTAIRAASSGLLEAGSLSPQEAELVTLIDEESVQLNELATRLLRTARLESTAIPVRREQCDLGAVVDRVLDSFGVQLGGRAVKRTIPAQGARVSANGELIGTALSQFIDNAIKYSWPGTVISVSVALNGTEAVVSVHNLGPAIRREDRERIFERFYRSPGTEHRAAGTGLGLSIAKKVAEAHLGRVWVVSHETSGTTFFLALPTGKEDANG
jgi:two-component system sensor histidine kinase KdpD